MTTVTGPRRLSWRWRAVPLAAAVLTAAVVAACGEQREPTGSSPLPPELAEGEELYAEHCALCHGDVGEGGAGPALSDGQTIERYPDVADNLALVRDGINAMPGFATQLTPEQIAAVVRYQREAL
jgi:mono/diheme cytochrome c family protein